MTKAIDFRNHILRDDQQVYDPVAAAYVAAIRLQGYHYSALASSSVPNAAFGTLTTGIADPFGGTTAVRFTDDGNTVYHVVRLVNLGGNGDYQGYPGEKNGGQIAKSFVIKANTSTKVDVVYDNPAGGTYVDRFNLTTGAHETDSGSGMLFINPLLLDGGTSGWWRIYTKGYTYQATAQDPVQFWLSTVDGSGTGWDGGSGYTGASNRSFDLWAYQSENAEAMCGALPYTQRALDATKYAWGTTPGAEQVQIPLVDVIPTPAACTLYARWLERGNKIMANATQQARTAGILRIGDMIRTAADSLEVIQTATGFTATLNNGGTTSTSAIALSPAIGDAIELLASVSTGGAITLHATLNGGSESAGTTGSAVGLPGAWSDALMTVNGCANALYGDMDLLAAKALLGDKTLAQARAAA